MPRDLPHNVESTACVVTRWRQAVVIETPIAVGTLEVLRLPRGGQYRAMSARHVSSTTSVTTALQKFRTLTGRRFGWDLRLLAEDSSGSG